MSGKTLSPAHTPLVIIGALLAVALIIAVATGVIGEQTFRQPQPSPYDPITVP